MIRKLLLTLLLVVSGFVAGLVVTGRMRSAADSRAEPIPAPEAQTPAPRPSPAPSAPLAAVGVGPDFTRVAGQAIKGVANISSLQVVRRQNSPFGDDPFFQYFFGGQDLFGSRDRRSLSLGSGVIVSGDGYVVTNNHVVGDNVSQITVSLPDKREVKGRVVGVDPATDIALLKVDTRGLTTVPWADSSKLQVGEWVLAIGSPFQLSQTVTAGMRGELVGINTGIFSQSGGYQGIGFAIPSNLAHKMVDDLLKYGEVHRGTIGGIVTIDRLTPQAAEELGLNNTLGAVVTRMQRGSAAYDVGIRPGDVIVRFNNTQIDDPSQLYRVVADARIGSEATIRVLRNGRSLDFKVPIVSDARARR
jgi:serine protease Do